MLRNFKNLFVCLAVTGLALAAFSCSKKGDAADQIRVLNYLDLTSANSAQEVTEVWEAYGKANPDVTIVREDLFNDPYHNKVEAYAASGQLPDVLYVWPAGRSTTLHTQRLLKDLLPFIDADGLNEVLVPQALDPDLQGGKYIAMLPRAITSSHAFYVNNEVLAAAGLKPAKTYAELKAQVPVLKSKGYDTILMANQDDWVMQSCLFSMIAGRFGGEGWEQKILSGETKFTDPDFLNALRFIKALYDDGVLSKATLTTPYGSVISDFAMNKGAYYIDGDWRIGALITDKSTGQALINPDKQKNISITVFPDIENAKLNKSSSTVLGTGWGINAGIEAGSKRERDAWNLVKWLSGKEIQTWLLETGGIIIPSRVDIDVAALDLEPLQMAGSHLANEYNVGTVVIDDAFVGDVNVPINQGLQEIGMGEKTPEQVAQTIQRAFDNWKSK